MEALSFGVEIKDTNAIKYASYLQSNKLYVYVDDTVSDYACSFLNNDIFTQEELLKSKLTESNTSIQLFKDDKTPVSSIFRSYSLILKEQYIKKYIEDYAHEIERINNEWKESIVPIFSIKNIIVI